MPDRRRHPRYPIKLKVYFIEEGVLGHTENISLDGCYVKASTKVAEGVVKDMLVEIPILGVLALKGYIQHAEEDHKKMGMQLVKVRFATDQEIYYKLYTKFVECLHRLDELHDSYLDLALQGKVKLLTMPKDTQHAHSP